MEHIRVYHKLTKEEAKALRDCHTAIFHYDYGRSYIRALINDKYEDNREIRIECNSQVNRGNREVEVYEASFSVDNVYVDSVFKTISQQIKEGDVVTLVWIADNNNNHVKNAGLHCDELRLKITRETRSGKTKHFVYNVGYLVSVNDLARMIKTR